jgi:hypothetical protein
MERYAMKTLNNGAAILFALVGALALFGGILDKDATTIGFGIALLISALILGTLGSVLYLLEEIRDALLTALKGR